MRQSIFAQHLEKGLFALFGIQIRTVSADHSDLLTSYPFNQIFQCLTHPRAVIIGDIHKSVHL